MPCHLFDSLAIELSVCTSLCTLLRLILYALAYTGEAGKKKWRGRLDGANIKRMCSPLAICVLLLCVVLFALMGGFYGVGDQCKISACWPTQHKS